MLQFDARLGSWVFTRERAINWVTHSTAQPLKAKRVRSIPSPVESRAADENRFARLEALRRGRPDPSADQRFRKNIRPDATRPEPLGPRSACRQIGRRHYGTSRNDRRAPCGAKFSRRCPHPLCPGVLRLRADLHILRRRLSERRHGRGPSTMRPA